VSIGDNNWWLWVDLTILSGTKLVALVRPKGENHGWFSTAPTAGRWFPTDFSMI